MLQIQFEGDECHSLNFSYFAAFASAFFFLALVCLVQLVTCIVAEWQRMKAPSFLRACRITTQKVLYFVVFLAAMIRGAYFTAPVRNFVFCLLLILASVKYVGSITIVLFSDCNGTRLVQ